MLTDLLGTIGVFMILLAYLLNIAGRLETTRLSFILLNLIGSSLACAASMLLHYLPFIILEGVWALVSFIALIKYLKTA